MFDHALEEIGALFLPIDAGIGFPKRGQHSILDAIGPRGGERFDHHRLHAFYHDASAHLDGGGDAELLACDLGVKTEFNEQRRERPGAGAPKQQGHLDAIGRDRRHDRALDIAAAAAIDQRCRTPLGARGSRIEIEEPGALFHRRRASLPDRNGLARRDGGNDKIGLRGEIGMRGRERDAMR